MRSSLSSTIYLQLYGLCFQFRSDCLILDLKDFHLFFFLKIFVVLYFACKLMIHFQLNFIYFFGGLWICDYCGSACWRTIFLHWITFALLWKISWTYLGLFLGSLFYCINALIAYGFDYCTYIVSLNIRQNDYFHFLLCQDYFSYSRACAVPFHINFRIKLSVFIK